MLCTQKISTNFDVFHYFINFLRSSHQKCEGPLSGVRILDMTRILAGPFCTMLLGDLGAEVLKIENPDGGDETRKWGPPFIQNESAYFFSVNRNKKSIAINIKSSEGISLIKELSKKSDIFIENYVPGKLQSYGLDYNSLKEIAPHLIYCSITGYGSSGPYHNRAGYDVISASVAGLLHITGPEDGDPCKVGVAMTDLSTGLYAHGAIMAALIQRMKSGVGQKIDCNLLSSQVSLLANIASNYLNCGTESKRWGTAHESIVPYQAFKTVDGYFSVGAGSDKQFQTFCKLLKLERLPDDPLFSTNRNRVQNRKLLISKLSSVFKTKCTKHWLDTFENSGIPYGPLNDISEVFKDPQVLHNEMVRTMNHSTVGPIKILGPAVSFSKSINQPRTPPPVLGEHTGAALSEILCLTSSQIQNLKEKGVLK